MDRSRAARGSRLGLAFTPMIDVIFLLLVFFICTVQFDDREESYKMDLPARGATADPLSLQDPALTIEVGARRGERCGIIVRGEGVAIDTDDFDSLSQSLAGLCRAKDRAGLYEPTHQVLVAPARDAQWQDAVDAFNAAVRAGFSHIGFSESVR